MIESASGIILRTRPLTETSLIVHWLTPLGGRLATVAKGARRSKSPFAGKLDLFYSADISFSRSRRSELHQLREVKLLETHGAIREDLVRLQQAAYVTAFIELATETETPIPEIYRLAGEFLHWLCRHEPRPQNVIAMELKLLHELGLMPALTETRLTAGAKKIVGLLLENSWAGSAQLTSSPAQSQELQQWLGSLLISHLGRLPRGRVAALAAQL